eukprot:3460474-Prymnesium_polylepis.1
MPDRAQYRADWTGWQAACAEADGLGCGSDRHMRAHMHPDGGTRGRRAAARNCGSRARLLLLLL